MRPPSAYTGPHAAEVAALAHLRAAEWGVLPHNAQRVRWARNTRSPYGDTDFPGWDVIAPIPGVPSHFFTGDLHAPLPELHAVQAAARRPDRGADVPGGMVYPYEGYSYVARPGDTLGGAK